MLHRIVSITLLLVLWTQLSEGHPKGKGDRFQKIKGTKVKPDDSRKKISNDLRGGGVGRGPQVTNIQEIPMPVNIPFPLMPYQVLYPGMGKKKKSNRRLEPEQNSGTKGFQELNSDKENQNKDLKGKRKRYSNGASQTGYVKIYPSAKDRYPYALLLLPIGRVQLVPKDEKEGSSVADEEDEEGDDEGERYIKEGYEEGKDLNGKNNEEKEEKKGGGRDEDSDDGDSDQESGTASYQEEEEETENEKAEGGRSTQFKTGRKLRKEGGRIHNRDRAEERQKGVKSNRASAQEASDQNDKDKPFLFKHSYVKQAQKQVNSAKRSDLSQQDFQFEDQGNEGDHLEYDEPLDIRIRDVSDATDNADVDRAKHKLQDTQRAAQVMTLIQQKLGADPNNIVDETHTMMNYMRKQMQQYDMEIDKDIINAQQAQLQSQDPASMRSGIASAKEKLQADRLKEDELRQQLNELKNVELMTTAIELAKYLALEKSKHDLRLAQTISTPQVTPTYSSPPAESLSAPQLVPGFNAESYQQQQQQQPLAQSLFNPPYPTMFNPQPYPFASAFMSNPLTAISHPAAFMTPSYPVATMGPSAFTYGQVEYNPRPAAEGSAEAMSRHQTIRPQQAQKPHSTRPAKAQTQAQESDWGGEGGSSLSFPGPTYSLPPFSAQVAHPLDEGPANTITVPTSNNGYNRGPAPPEAHFVNRYDRPVVETHTQATNAPLSPSVTREQYPAKSAPSPPIASLYPQPAPLASQVASYQPTYQSYNAQPETPAFAPEFAKPAASKDTVQSKVSDRQQPSSQTFVPPPVALAGPSAYYANVQSAIGQTVIPYQQPIITSYSNPSHPSTPVEVISTDAHDFTGQKKPVQLQNESKNPPDTSTTTLPYWFGLFPKLPDSVQDKAKQSGSEDQEAQKQYEDAAMRLQNTEKAAEALTHIENKIGFDPGSIAKLVDFVKTAAMKDVEMSQNAVARDKISVANIAQQNAKKSTLVGAEDVALNSAQDKLNTDNEILGEARDRLEKIKRMESVVTEIEAAKYDAIARAKENYAKKRNQIENANTGHVGAKKPAKRSTADAAPKQLRRKKVRAPRSFSRALKFRRL